MNFFEIMICLLIVAFSAGFILNKWQSSYDIVDVKNEYALLSDATVDYRRENCSIPTVPGGVVPRDLTLTPGTASGALSVGDYYPDDMDSDRDNWSVFFFGPLLQPVLIYGGADNRVSINLQKIGCYTDDFGVYCKVQVSSKESSDFCVKRRFWE